MRKNSDSGEAGRKGGGTAEWKTSYESGVRWAQPALSTEPESRWSSCISPSLLWNAAPAVALSAPAPAPGNHWVHRVIRARRSFVNGGGHGWHRGAYILRWYDLIHCGWDQKKTHVLTWESIHMDGDVKCSGRWRWKRATWSQFTFTLKRNPVSLFLQPLHIYMCIATTRYIKYWTDVIPAFPGNLLS